MCVGIYIAMAGNGYISLTTHYIYNEYIPACHIPGGHYHTNITYVLQKLVDMQNIDLNNQVSCFTTA